MKRSTELEQVKAQDVDYEYDLDVIIESSLAMAQATIENAMRDRQYRNRDLAARMGKPRSFISRMLSGSHNLTVKTLARALAVCGYELTWQYKPIVWGWAKEPVAVEAVCESEAASAASGFSTCPYALAAV